METQTIINEEELEQDLEMAVFAVRVAFQQYILSLAALDMENSMDEPRALCISKMDKEESQRKFKYGRDVLALFVDILREVSYDLRLNELSYKFNLAPYKPAERNELFHYSVCKALLQLMMWNIESERHQYERDNRLEVAMIESWIYYSV